MPKLSPSELSTLVKERVADCQGTSGDQIAAQQELALKRYRGDKLGNEMEGRSQVVDRSVAEAVDGLMPSLIRVFFSGDKTVEFSPRQKEDEEGAKQATELVNWAFMQQNDGFVIGSMWFKDALLMRLGTVKVWWDGTEHETREPYRGLTEAEYRLLKADPDIELEEEEQVEGAPVAAQAFGMPEIEMPSWNVTVVRTNKLGKVCIAVVPPDQFLVERDIANLDEARFCAHMEWPMVSDLVEEGYDRKEIEAANVPAGEADATTLRVARFEHETRGPRNSTGPDESSNRIRRTEAYIKVDQDDDGIAELHKLTCIGEGYEIFDDEIVDDFPFACLTPIIMPHKLMGMSIADQTIHFQEWQTAIIRGLNDSLNFSIAPRTFVTGNVNLDELLAIQPGGVVRGSAGATLESIEVPFAGGEVLPILEYIEGKKEQTTGVTRYNQGLDADTLNKTATGIKIISNAAQSRQELIARTFAETGVKRMFKLIFKCFQKYQSKAITIKLRNQWVPIDPRAWANDYDLIVSVGLGTGNKDQQAANIGQILMTQKELVASGKAHMVTDENIFNALGKLTEVAGFKSPDPFFTDPQGKQQAPPPEPPEVVKAKSDAQIAQQKAQTEGQIAQQKAQADAQIKMQQAELDRQQAEQDARLDAIVLSIKTEAEIQAMWAKANAEVEIAKFKAEHLMAQAGAKAVQDMNIKGVQSEHGMAMAEDQAEHDRETETKDE